MCRLRVVAHIVHSWAHTSSCKTASWHTHHQAQIWTRTLVGPRATPLAVVCSLQPQRTAHSAQTPYTQTFTHTYQRTQTYTQTYIHVHSDSHAQHNSTGQGTRWSTGQGTRWESCQETAEVDGGGRQQGRGRGVCSVADNHSPQSRDSDVDLPLRSACG